MYLTPILVNDILKLIVPHNGNVPKTSADATKLTRAILISSLFPVYAIVTVTVLPIDGRFLLPVVSALLLSVVMSIEAILHNGSTAHQFLLAVHLLFPVGLSAALPEAGSIARLWSAHIVLQAFYCLSFRRGVSMALINTALGTLIGLAVSDDAHVEERYRAFGESIVANGLLIFAFYHRAKHTAEAHLLDAARRNATMLAHANIQLREHTAQAQNVAVLQDRNRLARDIHDTVGHALTSVIVQLGAALETVLEDPADAAQRIEQARETAREGMAQIRSSVRSLTGPSVVEPRGRTYWSRAIQTFREATGIRVIESIDEEFDDIPRTVNGTVFRVIQEGLTNAVRHGQASAVEVEVRREDEYVLIRISDNGIGAKKVDCGHGLKGIRERVESLGGELEWRALPGVGFDLGIDIPVSGRREESGNEHQSSDRG